MDGTKEPPDTGESMQRILAPAHDITMGIPYSEQQPFASSSDTVFSEIVGNPRYIVETIGSEADTHLVHPEVIIPPTALLMKGPSEGNILMNSGILQDEIQRGNLVAQVVSKLDEHNTGNDSRNNRGVNRANLDGGRPSVSGDVTGIAEEVVLEEVVVERTQKPTGVMMVRSALEQPSLLRTARQPDGSMIIITENMTPSLPTHETQMDLSQPIRIECISKQPGQRVQVEDILQQINMSLVSQPVYVVSTTTDQVLEVASHNDIEMMQISDQLVDDSQSSASAHAGATVNEQVQGATLIPVAVIPSVSDSDDRSELPAHDGTEHSAHDDEITSALTQDHNNVTDAQNQRPGEKTETPANIVTSRGKFESKPEPDVAPDISKVVTKETNAEDKGMQVEHEKRRDEFSEPMPETIEIGGVQMDEIAALAPSSDEEEDVHQCGRCKEIFHSIEIYFIHKKRKTCKKTSQHVPLRATKPETNPCISPDGKTVGDIAKDREPDGAVSAHQNTCEDEQTHVNLAKSSKDAEVRNEHSRRGVEEVVVNHQDDMVDENRGNVLQNEEFTEAEKQGHRLTQQECSSGKDEMEMVKMSERAIDPRPQKRKGHQKNSTDVRQENVDDEAGEVTQKPMMSSVRSTRHGRHASGRSVYDSDTDPGDATYKPEVSPVMKQSVKLKISKRAAVKHAEPVIPSRPQTRSAVRQQVSLSRKRKYHNSHGELRDGDRGHGISRVKTAFRSTSVGRNAVLTQEIPSSGDIGKRGRPRKVKDADVAEDSSEDYNQAVRSKSKYKKRKKAESCPECEEHFTDMTQFDHHLRHKHGLSRHVCSTCGKAYRDKYKLKHHYSSSQCEPSDSDQKQYVKFPQPRVAAHSIIKTEDEEYIAKIAGESSPHNHEGEGSIDTLEAESLSGKSGHPCRECHTVFDTYRKLCRHVTNTHNVTPGICYLCHKWFTSRYKLLRHLDKSVHKDAPSDILQLAKAEIELLPYKIQWSGNPDPLAAHTSMPPKKKPRGGHMCSSCSEWFDSLKELELHISESHGKYTCESCSASFDKHLKLRAHLKEVHGIEEYAKEDLACLVCDRVLSQATHLYRHVDSLHNPLKHMPSEEMKKLEGGIAAHLFDKDENHSYSDSVLVNGEDAACHEPVVPHAASSTSLNGEFKNEPTQEEILVQNGWCALFCEKDIYHCFVCKRQLHNMNSFIIHMQHHRVWLINGPDGPTSEGMAAVYLSPTPTGTIVYSNDDPTKPELPQYKESMRMKVSPEPTPCVQTSSAGIDQNVDRSSVEPDMGNNLASLDKSDYVEEHSVSVLNGDLDSRLLDACKNDITSAAGSENQAVSHPDSATPDASHPETNVCADKECDISTLSDKSCVESERSLTCPYCYAILKGLQTLYNHKRDDHSLTAVFKCIQTDCKATFMHLKDYAEHSHVHSQRSFICCYCNDHFSALEYLLSHKGQLHRVAFTLTTELRCYRCKIVCDSEEALKKHVESHRSLLCPMCGKICKNKALMHDHIQAHLGIQPYLCDQCGQAFSMRKSLQRHRVNVHSDQDHPCELCPKVFRNREHLRRHVLSGHSTERAYKCTKCQKAFTRADKLRAHQRAHSSLKPYLCSICGKAYRYREARRYHEKTHLLKPKYFCALCNFDAVKPGTFSRHMESVHGIKRKEQYPCQHCPSVFQRPERLNRHRESVHGIKMEWKYNCEACKMGFPGNRSYTTHMNRVHLGHPKPRKKKKKYPRKESQEKLDETMLVSYPAVPANVLPAVDENPDEASPGLPLLAPPGGSTASLHPMLYAAMHHPQSAMHTLDVNETAAMVAASSMAQTPAGVSALSAQVYSAFVTVDPDQYQ